MTLLFVWGGATVWPPHEIQSVVDLHICLGNSHCLGVSNQVRTQLRKIFIIRIGAGQQVGFFGQVAGRTFLMPD
jgi:hypothetical protein